MLVLKTNKALMPPFKEEQLMQNKEEVVRSSSVLEDQGHNYRASYLSEGVLGSEAVGSLGCLVVKAGRGGKRRKLYREGKGLLSSHCNCRYFGLIQHYMVPVD